MIVMVVTTTMMMMMMMVAVAVLVGVVVVVAVAMQLRKSCWGSSGSKACGCIKATSFMQDSRLPVRWWLSVHRLRDLPSYDRGLRVV